MNLNLFLAQTFLVVINVVLFSNMMLPYIAESLDPVFGQIIALLTILCVVINVVTMFIDYYSQFIRYLRVYPTLFYSTVGAWVACGIITGEVDIGLTDPLTGGLVLFGISTFNLMMQYIINKDYAENVRSRK